MDPSSSPAALQSQVLQTTLAEISSARAAASTSSGCSASLTAPPAPDCCVICLEEVSEPGTALPCRHSNYDFLCLVNWLAVGDAKCPLCKAAVLEVRYADSTGLRTYTVPPVASTSTSTSSSSSSTSPSPGVRSAQTTFQHYFLNRSSTNPRRNRSRQLPPPYATITPTPTPSSALLKRRYIHKHNLYSLHIGANPVSRYRSGPTPADFASDPNLVSRARTFIRRELQVFSFLSSTTTTTTTTPASSSTERTTERRGNNAEFLLEYTIAILKTVDTQGAAGEAVEMLSDFLGRDSARLFLHELRGWLRSPCLTLEAWDRGVQYPDPGPGPDPDPDAGLGGKRMRGRGRDGDDGEEEMDDARDGGLEGGRRRGRGNGMGGGELNGRVDAGTRKGDFWRPGGGRYEVRKKRKRTEGELNGA
ncbi:hypothetical protein GE09DRAFT_1225632 [Coniochaeta sp. 2T2.1]|nr:hypothetical protein GE09DRAFT_1225632 [Coniochaeta sp. 2T2.1]